MEEGRQKSKRVSYTAKFKREVIRCAEEKGNRKAAAIFGVNKATFDCSGNTTQRSAGMRRHKGNSLDPRNDDFLKLIMQSSRFFPQERRKPRLFESYDLLREEAINKARSLNIPQSCGAGRRYAKRSVA
jgi:hypothetical protein